MSPSITNLTMSDYKLLANMKKELRSKKFITNGEVKEASPAYFEDKAKTYF